MPETPLTSAWPPSLPSVPTSRATRVTSSANDESWSTIALTVVPMRANSPLTGWPSIVSAIFWDRSPSATATSTRPTSVVGRTRSSISALTDSTPVAHEPYTPGSAARSPMRPSRPMTRATRSSSLAMRALCSTSSLTRDWTSPMRSRRRALTRTVKSPSRAAVSARRTSSRACSSRCAMPLPFGRACPLGRGLGPWLRGRHSRERIRCPAPFGPMTVGLRRLSPPRARPAPPPAACTRGPGHGRRARRSAARPRRSARA